MNKTESIILAFPFGKSAVADHLTALGTELHKQGFEIIVLSPGQPMKSDYQHADFTIVRWPSKRPTKFKDAIFLWKLIRKHRPIMILANFAAVNISLVVSWLLRVPCRIAYYHTADEYAYLCGKTRRIQNFYKLRKIIIYKLATLLMTVSHAVAEELTQIYKIPKRKIAIFYNALQDPGIIIKKTIDRKIDLICVGRLVFGKGHDILIKAMKIVTEKRPNTSLLIVGEGELKDSLQWMVEALGLEENISFTGIVAHQEVLRLVSDSKVLVLPTRFEAFPYAVIEALSLGTPVIASHVGGIPEVISSGVEGLLVPKEDPNSLAAAILELIDNPAMCDDMGQKGRKRFESDFRLEDLINRQSSYIVNLINQGDEIEAQK